MGKYEVARAEVAQIAARDFAEYKVADEAACAGVLAGALLAKGHTHVPPLAKDVLTGLIGPTVRRRDGTQHTTNRAQPRSPFTHAYCPPIQVHTEFRRQRARLADKLRLKAAGLVARKAVAKAERIGTWRGEAGRPLRDALAAMLRADLAGFVQQVCTASFGTAQARPTNTDRVFAAAVVIHAAKGDNPLRPICPARHHALQDTYTL